MIERKMTVDYSQKEVKLFKMFGYEGNLLELIDAPMSLYRMCVEVAFIQDMRGPHVEALRRAYKAMYDCTVFRRTRKFEKLIEFEETSSDPS